MIQGTAADMMKLAMVMAYEYVKENNLFDYVKFVMQVHDQLTTLARNINIDGIEWKEAWKEKLTELMEDAAKVIIPSGLLKAETNISNTWQK